MRHTAAGLGTANIGLGPVLLDFKDWVKAGQSGGHAASTVVASGNRHESHHYSEPHQQPRDAHAHAHSHEHPPLQPRHSYSSTFSSSNLSAEADYGGASARESYSSYGGGSSEYTSSSPHAPYRSSPIPRTIPTHSLPSSNSRASISSLSIDSSHSPKILGNNVSRLPDRPPQSPDTPMRPTAGATPRNTSYEFQRELSRLSLQSGRVSRSSLNPSIHQSPLGSPALLPEVESPLGADRARRQSVPTQSPLERRFSRRLMSRHDSQSSNLVSDRGEQEAIEEISPVREPLDERIREAEERLARRASLRDSPHKPASTPHRGRFNTTSAGLRNTVSPPLSNGHGTPQDQSGAVALQNGSSSRSSRIRPSIPAEFQQNERSPFTTPPADGRFAGLVDIGSPRSPLPYHQEEREEIVSPRRSTMAAYHRPLTSLDHRDGPNPFNPHRSRMSLSRTYSRDLDLASLTPGGRRELPARARPESVLETSADHQRYNSHGHGLGSARRQSQYGDERSQRLSALLSSDRDYSTRHSRDLGAQFGQRRDSTYSRDSVHSQRDSIYSQRDSRHSHSLSQRDSLSGQRDSFYSQRGSRDFARESLRLGDFGPRTHTRQESREVLGPTNRDSREFPRDSRDFSNRAPLAPSDSVSAVGSRGEHSAPRVESRASVETPPRKDPLEIIRKLEETRSKSNRQWEEDRSASAMSKYGEREMLARVPSRLDDPPVSARPGSRMSASRLGPRPASAMSSMRDSTHSGPTAPRTAPNLRRRLDSGASSNNLESPLVGRTSRASGSMCGPNTEPRVVRHSMTSQGGRISAGGRSGASSDQASTDHGRNLVDAARVLEQRGEIPADVLAKLSAAASLAERANGGVRAASQMATELALEIELDEPDHIDSVRKRFPRLAVTLKEANRASDQAVRDLTEALLAARGATTTATTTPARLGTRMETGRPPLEATHRRAMTLDSPAPVLHSRHSPSLSHAAVMSSPLMQNSRPHQSSERSEPWTPQSASNRLDPPLSSTSSRFEARYLDPIEQSPPKSTRENSKQNLPAIGLGISTPSPHSPTWEDRPPTPEPHVPHMLRKQASTLSTHTVRGNSFLPSHPPEATTALSNSPAYSTTAGQLPQHPEVDNGDAPTQDKERRPSLRLKELPQRNSVVSIASVYSNPEEPNMENGSDIARMGTFGAVQGAQIRASVSERFRKHLNGE
ncbi:hypothetical protein CcaverHIS002_0402980 [Cutaneotrichosporon cavernicola]|uniref:Uncharacterized protein n=1 Tax=Cutaneotrichosporon cavernicola TaxID=279322 RepID=A0AA48L3V1_9TREE|nr:uncharacterized protein CcaverHIS019_0402940 [Cutaneotrichosporon cavernicola]BEI83694.1 hypothetical protein CcaverHIS002_0402980 [Cutaneotrichosporon cavernicola]BEI91474.1 hypothetical protein CcaverHIS019_0402940 [Cutaneotrichosporon cavernicola]